MKCRLYWSGFRDEIPSDLVQGGQRGSHRRRTRRCRPTLGSTCGSPARLCPAKLGEFGVGGARSASQAVLAGAWDLI